MSHERHHRSLCNHFTVTYLEWAPRPRNYFRMLCYHCAADGPRQATPVTARHQPLMQYAVECVRACCALHAASGKRRAVRRAVRRDAFCVPTSRWFLARKSMFANRLPQPAARNPKSPTSRRTIDTTSAVTSHSLILDAYEHHDFFYHNFPQQFRPDAVTFHSSAI